MSLTDIQNIPHRKLVLVAGKPGAGKSTLSQQIALHYVASDRQVIYVTTESTVEDLLRSLFDRGLGENVPDNLRFVDAYSQTVGLAGNTHSQSVYANCSDLNSISMAIMKSSIRMSDQDVLLVFDSLTSPYLFNGLNIVKFIQQFLSKFAADGNRVLVTMDEGFTEDKCGPLVVYGFVDICFCIIYYFFYFL